MLDENFKLYLIEFNTNPCLEISSTLLARLIPNMVENAIRYLNNLELPLILSIHHQKYQGGCQEKENLCLKTFFNKIDLN